MKLAEKGIKIAQCKNQRPIRRKRAKKTLVRNRKRIGAKNFTKTERAQRRK